MNTKHFAKVLFVVAAFGAAIAHARDDGPRFAQDRLDALVAQHAEASRHIARASDTPPASAPEKRTDSAS